MVPPVSASCVSSVGVISHAAVQGELHRHSQAYLPHRSARVVAVTTVFYSDRAWDFGNDPDELWDRVAEVDSYESWWPWLRRFDGRGGLAEGSEWNCVVAPPLPYRVRFRLHLDRVAPGSEVHALVSGDIGGEALLTVVGNGNGSTARLRSELYPANPLLRRAGAVARPLIEWGHDWVLDEGCKQFVRRAF